MKKIRGTVTGFLVLSMVYTALSLPDGPRFEWTNQAEIPLAIVGIEITPSPDNRQPPEAVRKPGVPGVDAVDRSSGALQPGYRPHTVSPLVSPTAAPCTVPYGGYYPP